MSIHFQASDDRFCNSIIRPRRFTLDPNEVTCKLCKANDTFVITRQGKATIETEASWPWSVTGRNGPMSQIDNRRMI